MKSSPDTCSVYSSKSRKAEDSGSHGATQEDGQSTNPRSSLSLSLSPRTLWITLFLCRDRGGGPMWSNSLSVHTSSQQILFCYTYSGYFSYFAHMMLELITIWCVLLRITRYSQRMMVISWGLQTHILCIPHSGSLMQHMSPPVHVLFTIDHILKRHLNCF